MILLIGSAWYRDVMVSDTPECTVRM